MIVDIFWVLLIVEIPSMFLAGLVGLATKKMFTRKGVLVTFLVSIPSAVILSLLISLLLLLTGLATRIELWPVQ